MANALVPPRLGGAAELSAVARSRPPMIHFTPSCYHASGVHDIAAAAYHAVDSTWHVMAGCWTAGGWQHLTTTDLVSWTTVGSPEPHGGSGGRVWDTDGSAIAYAADVGSSTLGKAASRARTAASAARATARREVFRARGSVAPADSRLLRAEEVTPSGGVGGWRSTDKSLTQWQWLGTLFQSNFSGAGAALLQLRMPSPCVDASPSPPSRRPAPAHTPSPPCCRPRPPPGHNLFARAQATP